MGSHALHGDSPSPHSISLTWALAFAFSLLTPIGLVPLALLPLALTVVLLPLLVVNGRGRRVPAAIELYVILVGYTLLSALASGMPLGNLLNPEFYRRDAKFWVAHLPLLTGFLLARDALFAHRVIWAGVWMAATVAGMGVLEYMSAVLGGPSGLLVTRHIDGSFYFGGLFASHNATASNYAAFLGFAVGGVIAQERIPRRAFLAVALLFLGVLLSLSRSYIAAIVVVMAVALYGQRRRPEVRRLNRVIIAASLMSLPLLVPAGLLNRFGELTALEEVHNVAQRLRYWERAIQHIEASPIIGVGFGRFNDAPTGWLVGGTGVAAVHDASVVNNDGHAHNFVLMVLAELGLVGGILWLIYLGSLSVWTRRAARSQEMLLHSLGTGALLSLFFTFLASMVANNLTAPAAMWPITFGIGLGMGAQTEERL